MSTFIIGLLVFMMGAIAGICGLLAILEYKRAKLIKRKMQVPLGVVAGDGLDAPTVESINEEQLEEMDIEETQMLIMATQHFIDMLQERIDTRYEPTENEQATADLIEDDDREWAEALSLTHPPTE